MTDDYLFRGLLVKCNPYLVNFSILTHYPYWYSSTSKCVVDIVTSFSCPLLKEEKTTAQTIHNKTEYVYRYYFGEVHVDKKYSKI